MRSVVRPHQVSFSLSCHTGWCCHCHHYYCYREHQTDWRVILDRVGGHTGWKMWMLYMGTKEGEKKDLQMKVMVVVVVVLQFKVGQIIVVVIVSIVCRGIGQIIVIIVVIIIPAKLDQFRPCILLQVFYRVQMM